MTLTESEIETLKAAEQALDDWIVTYASEFCGPQSVKAAWKRISENGGTIAYATDIREKLTALIESTHNP